MTPDKIKDRKFLNGFIPRILKPILGGFVSLNVAIDSLKGQVFKVEVENQIKPKDYSKNFDKLIKSIKKLDKDKIKIEGVDFSDVVKQLQSVEKSISGIKLPEHSDVVKQLQSVEKAIKSIPQPKEVKIPSFPKIPAFPKFPKFPKIPEYPKQISVKESKDIISSISNLERTILLLVKELPTNKATKQVKLDLKPILDGLNSLEKVFKSVSKQEKLEFPTKISVDNFPPQMIPQPVTNMSINALSGYIETTATTVSTTLTTLPSYGVLDNRRSIIIYNNSSQTVYIGGSDVTVVNGLPVPKNTYSPPLDAGVKTILYGVVSADTSDVRCLEISDIAIGR